MGDPENRSIITPEFLTQQNWDKLTLVLTRYAQMKALKLIWRSRNRDVLAEGLAADDVAYNAIEAFINDHRTWNTKRYPNLLDFLKSVVDSKMSNLINSLDNTRRNGIEGYEELDQLSDGSKKMTQSPEAIALALEQNALADAAIDYVFQIVSGDAEMETYLNFFLGGDGNQKEIASRMGIPEARVYQLSRKLKRRLDQIREQVSSSGELMVERKE